MRYLLLILMAGLGGGAVADDAVAHLLAADTPPTGVVFEIVEGDESALETALPRVARLSAQLRERFPALPIAVVTHGREQFGLLAARADGPLSQIHADAQALTGSGVDLHVCGVHAGWFGHTPEEFPSYVDVSASGPAQLNDYENLGFTRVRLDADDE